MARKSAAITAQQSERSGPDTAAIPPAWGAYQDALDAPYSVDRWEWAQLAERLASAAQDLPSTSCTGRALYRASQDAYRRAGV